jgi:hypothetical protein
LRVFKKSVQGVPQLIVKCFTTFDGFTKEEICDALWNVECRREWDKVCQEFKIVENIKEDDTEIIYMAIQPPLNIISPRDFVQKRKILKNFPTDDSIMIHFNSVEHSSCPVNNKYIRAETIISGYHIKTISIDPLKTSFSAIVHNDPKGLIPNWILDFIAPKFPKEWIKNLNIGLNQIKSKKKRI